MTRRTLAVWLLAATGCGTPAGGDAAPKATAARPPCHAPLDTAGKRVVERRALEPAERAPEIALTGHDGQPFRLSEAQGHVALVGFIYTRCPDVCGLLAQSLLQVQQRFAREVAAGDLRLVLVSTDPERDTPEQNRKYTAAYGGRWTLCTGAFADCEAVWKAYGVNRTYNASAGYVYHTYKVVLIDRQGRRRVDYVGLDDPSGELTTDLTALLAEGDE